MEHQKIPAQVDSSQDITKNGKRPKRDKETDKQAVLKLLTDISQADKYGKPIVMLPDEDGLLIAYKLDTPKPVVYEWVTNKLGYKPLKDAYNMALSAIRYRIRARYDREHPAQDAPTQVEETPQLSPLNQYLIEKGYIVQEKTVNGCFFDKDGQLKISYKPIVEGQVNIFERLKVFDVPDMVGEAPQPTNTILKAQFVNTDTGDTQSLEIDAQDMQSRDPGFFKRIQSIVHPHAKKKSDFIHFLDTLGHAPFTPISSTYNGPGLITLDNELLFLHPAGAALSATGLREDIHVTFEPQVKKQLAKVKYGFTLPTLEDDAREDYAIAHQLLDVTPGTPGLGELVLGTVGYSPMSQLSETGGIAAIIYGTTGSLKSVVARLGLQCYAQVWGREEISTATLREGASTFFGVSQAAYYLPGMYQLFDDGLKGKATPQDVAKFYKFISGMGAMLASKQGRLGGKISHGQSGLLDAHYSRGSFVVTVEALPNAEQQASDLARFIVVSHDGPERNNMELLDALQSKECSQAMNRATCGYVQWLLPRIQAYCDAVTPAMEYYDKHEMHSRVVTTYAKVETGLQSWFDYGVAIGALTPQEATERLELARLNLLALGELQNSLMNVVDKRSQANDPVYNFQKYFAEIKRDRTVVLSDNKRREEGTDNLRPQPPTCLAAIDMLPDQDGWTYDEREARYEIKHAIEAGVLKYEPWDASNAASETWVAYIPVSRWEQIYKIVTDRATKNNTLLPTSRELLKKLEEKGKLKHANTNLWGRVKNGGKQGRCYLLDMRFFYAPDEDQTDITPPPTNDTPSTPRPLAQEKVPAQDDRPGAGQLAQEPQTVERQSLGRCDICHWNEAYTIWTGGKRYCDACKEKGETPQDMEQKVSRARNTTPQTRKRADNSQVNSQIETTSTSARLTIYVDVSTGTILSDRGDVCQTSPHSSLLNILKAASQQKWDVYRVYVCGPLPEEWDAWLTSGDLSAHYDTDEKRGHYFDAQKPEKSVVRYVGRYTRRSLDVRAIGSWLDKQEVSAQDAQAAMTLVLGKLQETFPFPTTPITSLRGTPAGQFSELWKVKTRIEKRQFEPLPDEIRSIIRSTAGQGRIEILTPQAVTKVPRFEYWDGNFMYAALAWGLPTELANHDDKNEYAGKVPARYRIRYTVPQDWGHVGLFMTSNPHTKHGGEWMFPGSEHAGQTFETWVDGCELDVLRYQYGTVEAGLSAWAITILERIVFKLEKDSKDKDPLGCIIRPLVALRQQLKASDNHIDKLGAGAIRSIVLHGIGAFNRKDRTAAIILDSQAPHPANMIDFTTLEDGRVRYTVEHAPLEAASTLLEHPEWPALVWARCRARITRAMLTLPREELLASQTDAIAMGTHPAWEISDKIGQLRPKGTPLTNVKAPHTWEQLEALKQKAGV